MSEVKTAWKPLLPERKRSLSSRQLKRLLKWLRSCCGQRRSPAGSRARCRAGAEEARQRERPPGGKNKPKPPPTVDVAPERAAAPVPAAVAGSEEPEPEEPPPTPAMMRAMRQVTRADRFEELLTRNTMEF